MTPWCDDFVCSWRRLLADRHSLPLPWTLSLHRRWCPSASHHPLTFLFLLALTFPLPSPSPSLGLSLCRPPCPSASPHSFPSLFLGQLCQRTKGGGGSGGGPLVPWRSCKPGDICDRGLYSTLPIPHCANSVLYVDYTEMPKFGGYDFALVVTCGLTRFTRVFPCTKHITGEETINILLEEWFCVYGAPKEINSDKDV